MLYVGSYRYSKHNGDKIWYFKSSYEFLIQYMKDYLPYTMCSFGGGEFQCYSNRNRSYFDLMGLCCSHVTDFSVKEFNEALFKLLISRKVGHLFCPNVDTYVFTNAHYHSNEFKSHNNKYFYDIGYNINLHSKKEYLLNLIFITNLGFIRG
jgi:hypothetical protein